MDLNYGDDEYWDEEGARISTKGVKRKRDGAFKGPTQQIGKRRKVSSGDTEDNPITFKSMAERLNIAGRGSTSLSKGGSFALLPDWRGRYAKENGKVVEKSMPVEMKKAAEGQDLVTPPKRRQVEVAESEEKDTEVGEGADEEDGNGDGDDMDEQLAFLDPETLKSILKQKLGDAGLVGMDEAFMQTIARMMSGEEGAEDALADSLLSKAADGQDTALSGWLSQQGIAVGDDGEDNGAEEAIVALPRPGHDERKSSSSDIRASPGDSAIGSSQNTASEQALPPSTPSSGKKRAAVSEDIGSANKRRANLVHPLVNGSVLNDEESDMQDDSIQLANRQGKEYDTIAVVESTAANAETRRSNKMTGPANTFASESGQNASAAQDVGDDIEVSSQPARQTRKRKADSEVADPRKDGGKQRQKQARKTEAVNEGNATPIGRRTRSARARSKK